MALGRSPAARGNIANRAQSHSRDVVARIKRLERQRSNVFGDWRLAEDSDGNLTATHLTTGVVRIIATPGEEN